MRKFRGGVPKQQLLRAYDRHDFESNPRRLHQWQDVLAGKPSTEGQPEDLQPGSLAARLTELGQAVRLACARGLAVKAYLTPAHPVIAKQLMDQTTYKMAVWDFLKPLQRDCRVELWDFAYPNAITLEGLAPGHSRLSRFFREDGHPRPTTGQLMAAQMFGRSLLGAPLRDLGIDLLALDLEQANKWIGRRQARWRGDWQGEDRQAVLADLALTREFGAP